MNQIWFGLIWINPKDLTRGKAKKKKCFGAYMDLALFRGVWKTFFVRSLFLFCRSQCCLRPCNIFREDMGFSVRPQQAFLGHFLGTSQVHRTTLGGPCVVEIQLCPD